jgi:putative aldouronate transport system permease protein
MKLSKGEKVFSKFNYAFLIIFSLTMIYPFWFSIIISLNNGLDSMRGGIYLWPRMWTLENYKVVLTDSGLAASYIVTISRTLLGTALGTFITGIFAYALSKKWLMGRKFFMYFAISTMFFSGGMIPTYILYKNLHLTDSFMVYIIPSLISVWNMIIMKTFFEGLPESIEESAKIDGYNDIQIFLKIIIPISAPIFAAIALFNGVWHWNQWFDSYIYINKASLRTTQVILLSIINQSGATDITNAANRIRFGGNAITPKAVQAATMIVTVLPILFIYPFLQKYFVSGIMLGSVKA